MTDSIEKKEPLKEQSKKFIKLFWLLNPMLKLEVTAFKRNNL